MQTVTDLVLREFSKLLEEELSEKRGYVISGVAVQDYADYKYRIGYIRGLEKIEELFEIAHSNVEKRT